jgi:CRISPR type IV-associated protein Csf2
MKGLKHFRIFGQFTTQSPLSHIGETISTTTYLVEEPILQPSGEIEPVFCYNGNAWRGQLRDLAAQYMLDKLGCTVSLEAFHLLFSGGRIGGDQSVDINQARQMRRVVPMIGLFGGGVGNQIMPGKLRVSSSYPVCREAMPALPDDLHASALAVSYRQLTMEKSYTRMDDSKNDKLTDQLISAVDAPLLEGGKAKKKEGEASTQMRMTSELLIPGVVLHHEIDCLDVSLIELGALVSAMNAFAASPYIGGQCNRGHGRVKYASTILDMETGEAHDFIKVDGGLAKLSQPAAEAKEAYDKHLQEQYDQFLAKSETEIRGLLGAEQCGSLF